MKLIKTEDAVGHVLCHDITQIIKDLTKDAVFCKGHIVTEEDIPVLLSVGKENLYVWEKEEGMLHENDAAEILRQICQGEHMHPSDVKEGKIELIADIDGVLKFEREKLRKVNSLGEMMIASRHGDFPVKKGDKLAGTRVIPLVISEEKMQQAKDVTAGGAIFNILPYKKKKAGIVTTGSEVYYHRIKDTFTPVIEEKLAEYDIEIGGHEICNDDPQMIENAIRSLLADGCNMIVCTGGMSVDPDDKTPGAIKASGARIVTYGAPTLPGAMLCLGYFEDGTPIAGLPGCVMYAKATVFDLILPRVAAGVEIERRDIIQMGHGGLCLGCKECHYPVCPFGKEA